MAVKIQEWVQREWTRPNISLYTRSGDFDTLSALIPDEYGNLARLPGWSSGKSLKTGVQSIRGAFWDEYNNRFVFIGQDAIHSKINCFYYYSTWSTLSASSYDLTSSATALGGKHMHNVAYWGGDLYIIGNDSKVYRGSSYTSALSSFYATADAKLLAPCGDRMYMVTTGGTVYRLNDADDAFEVHYTPIGTLEVVYITPFRGYLALFARGDDGTLYIYRLPDRSTATPVTLAEIGKVEAATGELTTYGSPFAVHDDSIYFSPGWIDAVPSGHERQMEIFEFNGSQIRRITTLKTGPYPGETAPTSVGLITWREHLIFYALTDNGSHEIKILVGDSFTDFTSLTTDSEEGYVPHIASLNGELIITGYSSSAEKIFHCGYQTALSDGHVITSRLDMGNPGKLKRLERITVLLNNHDTGFKIPIKYRVNDATSWTTATTANGTRRASVGSLGVSFYTLQLKIELDDDTTYGREDNRIEAISVVYTEAQ